MKKYLSISSLLLIAAFVLVYSLQKQDGYYEIGIELKVEKPVVIGLFYNDDGSTFDSYKALYLPDGDTTNFVNLNFKLDKSLKIVNLRFDLDALYQRIEVKGICLKDKNTTIDLSIDTVFNSMITNDYIKNSSLQNGIISLDCEHGDPFFYFNDFSPWINQLMGNYALYGKIMKWIVIGFLINAILLIVLMAYKKFKSGAEVKFNDLVLVILFMLFLTTPLVIQFFGKVYFKDEQENRVLAKKPSYYGQSFRKIIEEIDTYYLDHFGLRKPMIKFWCYFNYKYFNVSAIPDRIQIGSNHWLYSKDYAEITQVFRFSEADLKTIRHNMEERAIWLHHRGIKYYMVIPPSKPTIYPENLPPIYINKSKPSLINQVLEVLKGIDNLVLIDTRDSLYSAKKNSGKEIYYRSDTHWNFYGGFKAYQVIANRIHQDFPSVVPYKLSDYDIKPGFDYGGDLYKSLAIQDIYPRNDYYFKNKSPNNVCESYSLPNKIANSLYYENQQDSCPRLYMIRDSYGVALVPFLMNHFKRSTFLWTYELSPDVVDFEKPDLFIQEKLEIYLMDLLKPNDPRIIHEVDSIKKSQVAPN